MFAVGKSAKGGHGSPSYQNWKGHAGKSGKSGWKGPMELLEMVRVMVMTITSIVVACIYIYIYLERESFFVGVCACVVMLRFCSSPPAQALPVVCCRRVSSHVPRKETLTNFDAPLHLHILSLARHDRAW